jgi:ribonucleoside-triphosphate reductase
MKEEKIKRGRQECEVFSRVCGYMRPTKNWNAGKQAEFADRKMFNVSNIK